MEISPQLKDYILKAREAKLSDEVIFAELRKAGWAEDQVVEALKKPHVFSVMSDPKPLQIDRVIQSEPKTNSYEQSKANVSLSDSMANQPPISVENLEPKGGKKLLIVLGILIGVMILSGASYALIKTFDINLGFGGGAPYTDQNLISGLLAKTSSVKTSTYRLTGSLNVVQRDKDARPFEVQVSNEAQLREQYQNDAKRISDIQMILTTLQRYGIADYKTKVVKKFPADLKQVMADYSTTFIGSRKTDFTDPVSGKQYEYMVIDGGNDFNLRVTFETQGAISALKKSYNFVATSTFVSGNTVTFTKKSPSYFYMSSEPPKPFLVQMGEMARMLPPEMSVTLSSGATTDLRKNDSDWKWDFDGKGDFGDMSYAVNLEVLRKDKVYYARFNKIPSILLSFTGGLQKGQWIKIDPNASSTSFGQYSFYATDVSKYEDEYKEKRESAFRFIKEVAEIADREKLIEFVDQPKKIEGGERSNYEYSIKFRKEAVLPFYRSVQAISKNYKDVGMNAFDDQGMIEYLESQEFSQVFDYYDKNTSMTILTDKEGYLTGITYKMRIVPGDTAINLKDKQANLLIGLNISNINKSVSIEAPTEWKTLDELYEQMTNNLYNYAPGSAEAVKNELNNIQYLYGTGEKYSKAFALGACKRTAGTIFSDEAVSSRIEKAAGGNLSAAYCASSVSGLVTSAYAVSVPITKLQGYSWCFDSTGASKQISGNLKGTTCN
ncbi:MAG: hypothetical protein A3H57_04310 [Candidatus Taylorbacteria bacterium RIFCSPLOWO2_02_FULL_43_11]|uniref:Uncharacterized protein n=1 Tax=Candidatus Taylorbacteria bacterium RIFCSPHIGHO2_02_FULL_43_32b TaxID=1802306 RepID=A0A1G2MNB3_9BACT|nr:MAG: hypothetical protein A2743_02670 [Candidatus Taylorbacteria bacterium RIFCSPHIGHO2_01_FULL_43_47]OHA24699.1 MAG: hypothetical protein A3C72_03725 [Candidatus Taylorbacteria bacterium RIFCSPHIGHO2_02_FULL_43_32b]OHA31649.1 MAG: hypothetical protein A3B08_02445 [Candidatus Taylorbacteria bacterium RIFCSPLOWO2_01_FULL_43_44]OHA35431.1 MAG: hypothetical protein A3H57_04310 [Candidatus Taylorbacteria bacterium RIFCSPLOWO2_02_FULL_43_11]